LNDVPDHYESEERRDVRLYGFPINESYRLFTAVKSEPRQDIILINVDGGFSFHERLAIHVLMDADND